MKNNYFYWCKKYETKTINLPLLFFHVPKCAGTTLSVILSWLINPQSRVPGPLFFNNDKGGETAYEKFNKIDNYQTYNKIKFLYGHFPFEILEYLQKPFFKITVLRDPIDRCFSHYNWILNRKYSSADIDLQTLFKTNKITKNTITNQFSGIGVSKQNTDIALNLAYKNLTTKIDKIYKSENLLQALKDLISMFDLPDVLFQNHQESLYENKINKDKCTAIIRENNALDIELFSELNKNKFFEDKKNKIIKKTDSDFLFSSPLIKVQDKNNILLKKEMLQEIKSHLNSNNFNIKEI